jgi:LysM repeat protein
MAWVMPASAAQSHQIQPGDTLSEIAEIYGVSVNTLARYNGITDPNSIFIGEDIAIPAADGGQSADVSAPAVTSATYTVRDGDSLWDIASSLGTTVEQLLSANPQISDPSLIRIGDVLNVPAVGGKGGSSGTITASAPPPVSDVTRAQVGRMLADVAGSYGLDPSLVQALAWQESGWQQGAVSPAGAVGVMQLMPDTAAWVSEYLVGTTLNVNDSVSDNIVAGTAFLRWLYDNAGSETTLIAAYYQGLHSVENNGMMPDTEQYVASIQSIRQYINQHGAPPSPN